MLAAIDDGIVSHLAGGLYLFVTAIALLLGITGSAFCCQVPRGSRARTLILVSLVADALGALFFFVAIVAALGDALGLGGRNLSYVEQGCEFLSTIVSVFGLILFLLFLKQLAYYLDENIMGDQATDPIAYAAALIGGTIVGDILVRFLFKLGTNAPLLGTAFLLVALLAFFYFAGKLLMMSLNTIGPIRNALEKRLAPSARSWRQEIPRWAWLGVTGATLALLGSLLLLVGIAAWRNTASASPAQPSPAPKQDGPLAGKGPDDSPADLLPPKVPPPATDFEGLLAYWPFEDGKPGESVADLSPNRINGRAVGGSSVEGIRGKALHLSNPYCFDYTADHRLNFPAGADFTLACWVKTASANGMLLSQRNSREGGAVIDVLLAGGQVQAQVRQDKGFFHLQIASQSRINDNRWHHWALLRRGQVVELFVDGRHAAAGSGNEVNSPITTDLRTLGREGFWESQGRRGAETYFTGDVDEFCIFNRALDPDEIQTLAGRQTLNKKRHEPPPTTKRDEPPPTTKRGDTSPTPSGPKEPPKPEPKVTELKDWGEVINPDKDCKLTPADAKKITFEVPGKLHDLYFDGGPTNAPRVMREVTGDFVVTVKVSGEFKPGPRSTSPKTLPYHGAGILLWSDSDNNIRFERIAFLRAGKMVTSIGFQERKGGHGGALNNELYKAGDCYLRMERKGSRIHGAVSSDGTTWKELKPIDSVWPAKLKVGLTAISTSSEPFSVTFEDFDLKGE